MSESRFSSWFPPTAEAFASMPAEPAVIQVKVLGRLVRYPTGQSAMIWYGTSEAGVGASVGALDAVAQQAGDPEVAWRYLLTETPEADLARLLKRFVTRFGAAPSHDAGA